MPLGRTNFVGTDSLGQLLIRWSTQSRRRYRPSRNVRAVARVYFACFLDARRCTRQSRNTGALDFAGRRIFLIAVPSPFVVATVRPIVALLSSLEDP